MPAELKSDHAAESLKQADQSADQAAASLVHAEQGLAEAPGVQTEVGPHLRPRGPEPPAGLEQAALC